MLFLCPQRNFGRHIVIDTVHPSIPLRVRCISPIFFEVGIPNLVCGCILGWQRVAYHFRVTVTLTSDLVIPRRSRRDIVLAASVRLSVHSVRPSVRPSGTISQYLLVRFDSYLVQMISTMDSQTSNKFGQNQPLNT